MSCSYLLIPSVFWALCILQSGCSTAPDFWREASPGQKKILVSFPPLYCITHAVAGKDAYVLCMLTSQGPHDYDGSPTDAVKVSKADLFIYNGLTLDDAFAERMLRNQSPPVKDLNVGKTIENSAHELLLEAHEHVDVDGAKHKHGDHDPHLWLGPRQAVAMTKIIAAELGKVDPANQKGYEERADQFIEELKKLEEYGKKAFEGKKHKSIVTMHESLGYFAQAFGLKIVGAIQARPGMDPDAKNLAKLKKLSVEQDVRLFAVEPQYSKRQAETLQNSLKRDGIDVRIVLIDPLETAPVAEGKRYNPDPGYYLQRMRENIDTLARAMP